MRGSSSDSARTMMETGSGLFFDFANPAATHIAIEDIAQALGNTCRFGGHCPFYSVACHARFVARLVLHEHGQPDLAFAALHHDSHEAYVGDIPTPAKVAFGSVYVDTVTLIDEALGAALGIDPALFHHPVVKAADEYALRVEASHLKKSRGIRGAWPWRKLPPFDAGWTPGLAPKDAGEEFLLAHAELTA